MKRLIGKLNSTSKSKVRASLKKAGYFAIGVIIYVPITWYIAKTVNLNESSELMKKLSAANEVSLTTALDQIDKLLVNTDLTREELLNLKSVVNDNKLIIDKKIQENKKGVTYSLQEIESLRNTNGGLSNLITSQRNQANQLNLAVSDLYDQVKNSQQQKITNSHSTENTSPPKQETLNLHNTTLIDITPWQKEFIVMVNNHGKILKLRAGNSFDDDGRWMVDTVNKSNAIISKGTQKMTLRKRK